MAHDDETKLGTWAQSNGVDWSAARAAMKPGDLDAYVGHLRAAKSLPEPARSAERGCVIACLRLLAGQPIGVAE